MQKHLFIKISFSNIILLLEELSHCTFQYSLNITKEEKIVMEILLSSILEWRGLHSLRKKGFNFVKLYFRSVFLSSLLEIKHCLKILRMCCSLTSDSSAFPSALYAEQHTIQYGISLWPLGASSPGCIHSQLLLPLQPSHWKGMRS